GHWDAKGDHYIWIEGAWGTPTKYPPLDQPPPEAKPETSTARPDQVWMPGFWFWRDGRYVWHGGYATAPAQRGFHYEPAHWTRGADHWNFTPNDTVRDIAPPPPPYATTPPPPPPSGPTSPPPPPRNEDVQPRA